MKILYILKEDPDPTLETIINEHQKTNEVVTIDLRRDKCYERIIELIETSDKVISW